MPLYALQLRAELENIREIRTSPDMRWYMSVKCVNCNEITASIWVSLEESRSTGRGESHFLQRCKGCRRENSLDIVAPSQRAYTSVNG